MGLIDYAYVHFFLLFALCWPDVNKKMPVHDWLWDNYGHDEHLVQYDTNPCSKQGSGVFKDYIVGVEQKKQMLLMKMVFILRFALSGSFTLPQKAFLALLRSRKCGGRGHSRPCDAAKDAVLAAPPLLLPCQTMASVI